VPLAACQPVFKASDPTRLQIEYGALVQNDGSRREHRRRDPAVGDDVRGLVEKLTSYSHATVGSAGQSSVKP